jgi:hypothetical protein
MLKFSKKLVYILGIIFLGLLIIMNLIHNATVENAIEHVRMDQNTVLKMICVLGMMIILLVFFYEIKKIKSSKITKTIIITLICLYFIISIFWIFKNNIKPVDDAGCIQDVAVNLKEGNLDAIKQRRIY